MADPEIDMSRIPVLTLLVALAFTTPATADEKPTLTIYTYDAFAAEWGPGPLLKQGFEAQCACTLDFVAADSSIGALRRVQLEGPATKADIVLGLDTATVQEARNTGLFTEHSVDTGALKIPTGWSAPDFVPFDFGYFAFVYRKADLAEPPHDFQELAGEDDNLKIVIEDPRTATPGLGLVLWVKAAYGNDANEAWAEIAPHVVTMTADWSAAYNLFLQGEADMVLSYTTSPAYHRIAEDDFSYEAASFDEGHYLQIEVAGILKSSPHKDLANQFLTYLVSEKAQNIIPTTNWMYPVLPVDLPEGFDPQPEKTLLLPDDQVAANAAAWTSEMLAAFR
ncbi:MAG: thiamine ABC transporter substrate binding subunit [Hyphomicrobiaceae bacterium]|nr:thiamine ABC transporter substrate binding subunit [Hyphomicrobiaceae bacterium]